MNLKRKEEQDQNLIRDIRSIPESLRLIDTRDEAQDDLKNRVISRTEVLSLMEETGLDLYLVTMDATPPVYKLLDYGKFRYDEQKRQRENQKRQREHLRTVKEIYFKPGIGEHDVVTKIKHIRELLEDHDVKIVMKLNHHNKFILTLRWSRPLHDVVKDDDFVLRRVLSELGEKHASTKINVTENQIFATLKG